MVPILCALLVAADAALAAGLVLALRVRARERALVGEVVARSEAGLRGRLPWLAAAAAGVPCAVLARAELPLAWTLPPVLLALAYLLAMPGREDRIAGRDGVRRGWYVRALKDLEEWRVTGDHLRFRLRGPWEAVPLPAALHPEFEAKLRALAPERESRFK